MIINQQNLSHLFTGFRAAFQSGFAGVKPMHGRIAMTAPSTTSEEKYGWLGAFPNLREWVGDRHVKGLALHDYSIRNRKFEATVSVSRDSIDDDTYGLFTPMVSEMGRSAAAHPDQLVFEAVASGFSQKCYDGQPFFDTDHPVGEGSETVSVSNFAPGSGPTWYLFDTSRVIKPVILQNRRPYDFKTLTDLKSDRVFMSDEFLYGVDARLNVGYGFWQLAYASKESLTADSFDAALTAMQSFKSDEQRPLGINPDLMVVPPSLRATAKKVIETQLINGGESNPNYQAVEVIVCPWLA